MTVHRLPALVDLPVPVTWMTPAAWCDAHAGDRVDHGDEPWSRLKSPLPPPRVARAHAEWEDFLDALRTLIEHFADPAGGGFSAGRLTVALATKDEHLIAVVRAHDLTGREHPVGWRVLHEDVETNDAPPPPGEVFEFICCGVFTAEPIAA